MKLKKSRVIFLLILIFIAVKVFQIRLLSSENIIVIDPGHGGMDPGTVGINQSLEKDINLDISKKLYKKLRLKGYKVVLTRNNDEYIENIERANLANKKRARVFVSIHCNSIESDNHTNGVQVLYHPNRNDKGNNLHNSVLAQEVLDSILLNTGAVNKSIVERTDLIVLNQTKMPAVIVECGFLSNKQEADLLLTKEYQNKIVNGIIGGLERYVN